MTAQQYTDSNMKTPLDVFFKNGVALGFTVEELRACIRSGAMMHNAKVNGKTIRVG